MSSSSTDLLLLNASNYPAQPIFPYAYVKLRALARQRRLSVSLVDLLGLAGPERDERIRQAITATRPRMVGFHLRQADSVDFRDYGGAAPAATYFPVDETFDSLAVVRRHTRVPVVVGGIGFSTHPEPLFATLQPDLGVVGDPEAFLDSFDTLADSGCPSAPVANLMWWSGGRAESAHRAYSAPLDEREYDDQVVDELIRFYGERALRGPRPPTVAVDLSRGCPYRCFFCTEPGVNGRQVRVRDLDVVMDEVRFVRSRGLRWIWLVCSELNMGSAELAVAVAERFLALNAEPGQLPVRWRAYHLPRWLSRAELELMYRSGFAGGWNDFPALDDDVLRRTRVPYRTRHAIAHVRETLALQPGDAYGGPAKFSIFLGNAFATPAAIARSLQRFDAAGLSARFGRASVGAATRFFDHENFRLSGAPGTAAMRSYSRRGAVEPDAALPSYFLAPALREHFGDEDALLAFFDYVGSTLLSDEYRARLDWHRFLVASTTLDWLVEHGRRLQRTIHAIGEDRHLAETVHAIGAGGARQRAALRALFGTGPRDAARQAVVAYLVCERLARPAEPGYVRALRAVGLGDDAGTCVATPYRAVTALLARYDHVEDAIEDARRQCGLGHGSLAEWQLRRTMFELGVELDPRWRACLVPDDAGSVEARCA